MRRRPLPSRSWLALPLGLTVLWVAPWLPTPATGQGLDLALEPTVSGLARPLGAVAAGDGSQRLFIVEQGGLIKIWTGSQLLPTPFLDLSTIVSCCGEQGLLGLAFHPGYAANGFFYVGYTDQAGDTVIARYSVSATDVNVADPSSALTLLAVAQPAGNHNNDALVFGPDGFLYVGMGDGGSGSSERGQDLTSLLGKILRIDVDGDDFPGEPNRNYAIPLDNPFVGDPNGRDEIWAYGLRNPWRHSFDRETGDLWLGDVGAGSLEEIDFQPASSTGGENYGWRLMEGTSCFNPPSNCNDGSLTLPVLEYDHGVGCSVTGGYRYRGSREPGLRGVYLYGDFCEGTIWGTVPRCDGVWESQLLIDTALRISSFGEDELGEVYVADLDGEVARLARTGVGGPALASSPTGLDFGSVSPNLLITLPLTLTNSNLGPEAVTIESLAPSAPVRFTLDLGAGPDPCGSPPVCLAPGATCSLEVSFSSIGGSFQESLAAVGNFDPLELPMLAVVPCGGPDDLVVEGVTIDTTSELVGCSSVTVGPDTIFGSTSLAAIRSGGSIRFLNGVLFEPGATVRVETDPSLQP